MLAVRTTGPSLELPVVVGGLGVLSRRGLGVMVDAANERYIIHSLLLLLLLLLLRGE